MKPDPNQFAKTVLWQLAGARADIYRTQLLVEELLARELKTTASEIREKWEKETGDLQERMFSEALQSVGLEDDPPGPDDPDRG